jgi:hypothetical protein
MESPGSEKGPGTIDDDPSIEKKSPSFWYVSVSDAKSESWSSQGGNLGDGGGGQGGSGGGDEGGGGNGGLAGSEFAMHECLGHRFTASRPATTDAAW